jgi:glycosyltransferase involved in cell wall biosynthesis
MVKVSVIFPCLNEEKSVGFCIKKVLDIFKSEEIDGEVIVVDNGSRDKSVDVAIRKGARVLHESKKGYGNAYIKGLREVKGDFIILVDADGSYDLNSIPNFLNKLKDNDLVIGNRFYNMEKGAMPLLNKAWNFFLRFLLHSKGLWTKETCTGFVGVRKGFVNKLDLKSGGMEFSSEFLLKAIRHKGQIVEIPINFKKRVGFSKVNKIRDGIRHLNLILREF